MMGRFKFLGMIALSALTIALPGTALVVVPAQPAMTDPCPSQEYDCSPGSQFDGDDNGVDSSGRCGDGWSHKSCIDVNGSKLHVNYAIVQGWNCDGCQPRTNAAFFLYKITPGGDIYGLALTPFDKIIPGDGLKHGWKWNHGGVGWHEEDGTYFCGLIEYHSGGDTFSWVPAGCVKIHF